MLASIKPAVNKNIYAPHFVLTRNARQVRAIGAIEAIGDAAWHTDVDRLLGGLPG